MTARPGQTWVVLLSIILALAFWFGDSCIHFFLYGEPVFQIIPQDINELWMRTTIVILLVAFGAMMSKNFAIVAIHRGRENEIRTEMDRYVDVYGNALIALRFLTYKVDNNNLTPEKFYAQTKVELENAFHKLQERRERPY